MIFSSYRRGCPPPGAPNRGWLRAVGVASALGLAPGAPAQPEALQEAGQVVEVRTDRTGGTSATVCLEAAPGITRRKRLIAEHAGGREALATAGADRGPHCANFDPGDRPVTVHLEYHRLLVFPARLPPRVFRAEQVRGRTLTFRWTRD